MLTAGLCEARSSPARILHPCRKNDASCRFLRRIVSAAAPRRTAENFRPAPANPARLPANANLGPLTSTASAPHLRTRRPRAPLQVQRASEPAATAATLMLPPAPVSRLQTHLTGREFTPHERRPHSRKRPCARLLHSRQSRYSRARNAARGISSAPRRSMCGVVCWQSTISTPRSRSHAVRCTTAALEASG